MVLIIVIGAIFVLLALLAVFGRSMGRYAAKRILLMFLTLFVIMTICFILIKLLPLPLVKSINKDVELQKAKYEQRGYYKPIMVQYFNFWKNVLTEWNWGMGEQLYTDRAVWPVMMQKLPYTILVNLYSILIAIPIGLAFGIYAALKKNKWQDNVISTTVMIFTSVPSYVYAFLVQLFLCVKLRWFDLTIKSLDETPLLSWQMFVSMIPAVISLGFGVTARLTRYTRAELSEVLTGDYMLLARTKGLTKAQAISRHAMRNSMVVILPMIIGEFIGIIGGSLLIERIFAIPGLGNVFVDTIAVKDYNFFRAETFFDTVIGLASGILTDISYGFIDPRIRMGSRK